MAKRKPPVAAKPLTATMYYVVPKQQQDAWRGSNIPRRNISAWGVFATADAAWDYIQRTNRRLCATVVAL